MALTLPGSRHIRPLEMMRGVRDPISVARAARARYGPTYQVATPYGPVAVIGEPCGVQALFTAPPDTVEPFQSDVIAPFVGDGSVLQASGRRHQQQRKLLAPPFHGARMRAYGNLISEVARNLTAGLRENQTFLFFDFAQSISIAVIATAVLGLPQDRHQIDTAAKVIMGCLRAITPPLLFFKVLQRSFFGRGPWMTYQRAAARLDTLLYQAIAQCRAQSEHREDILSMLVTAEYDDGTQMSDRELRDQLITLLFAGYETTAVSMSWAIYWLHREPATLARLKGEIEQLGRQPSPEALAALPYLDAVCHEAMRLCPVVSDIVRTLRAPLTIAGHLIPPGTTVSASVILAHSNPAVFPEPDQFRPERFLERKYSPYEFFPFGGGARRCVGAAFALYEMKIVLSHLLTTNRFELVSRKPSLPRRRGFALAPHDGVPIRRQAIQ